MRFHCTTSAQIHLAREDLSAVHTHSTLRSVIEGYAWAAPPTAAKIIVSVGSLRTQFAGCTKLIISLQLAGCMAVGLSKEREKKNKQIKTQNSQNGTGNLTVRAIYHSVKLQ